MFRSCFLQLLYQSVECYRGVSCLFTLFDKIFFFRTVPWVQIEGPPVLEWGVCKPGDGNPGKWSVDYFPKLRSVHLWRKFCRQSDTRAWSPESTQVEILPEIICSWHQLLSRVHVVETGAQVLGVDSSSMSEICDWGNIASLLGLWKFCSSTTFLVDHIVKKSFYWLFLRPDQEVWDLTIDHLFLASTTA